MNTKIILTCITLLALLAPITGFTEFSDANRTDAKVYVKNTALTTKIKDKLAKENMPSTFKISVDTVNNGDVTLTGTAKTKAAADKAVSIARGIEGVKNVNSKIKIKADY